jgi:hypothetical protein
MGMFCQRWLALYRTKDRHARAKIIVDAECEYPFGATNDMVDDDCAEIVAFVALPDDYVPHTVMIGDDAEIEVQDIEEED